MSDIKLKQNDTQYLLYVPPSEKARAKSIEGYKWDASRRCWVYPKTESTRRALIDEFQNDLATNQAAKPAVQALIKPPTHYLPQDIDTIKTELTDILARLESLPKPTNDMHKAAIKRLNKKLASSEKELTETTKLLKKRTYECEKARHDLAAVQANIHSFQTSNDAADPFFKLVKKAAIEATGFDSKFFQMIERLNIDEKLPIELQKHMEFELRKMLKIQERTISFGVLLARAKDSEILPSEALDMAHLIRKQRNVVAHGEEYKTTYIARIILCLFAAALIWPELPE